MSSDPPPPAADHSPFFPGEPSSTPQELTLSYLCEIPKSPPKSDPKKGKEVAPDPAAASATASAVAAADRWVERDFLQLSTAKRDPPAGPADASDSKKPKLETLSLSLAPPHLSLSLDSNPPAAAAAAAAPPPRRAPAYSAATNSDDFAASMSYSYSLPFSHNPSCSLTRNSTDNFADNDQIWYAGEGTNGSVHSRFKPVLGDSIAFTNPADFPPKEANNNINHSVYRTNSSDNLSFFPSKLPSRVVKAVGNVTVAASSDSNRNLMLTRPDRVLREMVSESVSVVAQTVQEFPAESVEAVKECLRSLINTPEKKEEFGSLQRRLERRSDLTAESLAKAHRVQLEILVAIRTGIASFLSGKVRLQSKELVEVFLQLRCRNVNCKSLLPVDDCDCKICSTKKGFCSACMCPVCSNFDCASNTCSWVGCDLCSHWCHAVCGIEKNLIRPAPSQKGGPGMTEMQFRCLGCGHNSEMFGFVKEVFQCCAELWGFETLMKELDCVIKIFRGSEDFEGKELQRKAEEMRTKLGKKLITPIDACNGMLQFFKYGASDFSVTGSSSKKVLATQASEPSDAPPLPPPPPPPAIAPLKTAFNLKPVGSILKAQTDAIKTDTKPSTSEMRLKEEGFQDLETMVKFKEAEARLFQRLADDARREEEGYRQIVRAKTKQLEEEYTSKLSKLCLQETEERRRQKLEELKFLENSHCDYQNMKMRMQAEIASLLERMEATKEQWQRKNLSRNCERRSLRGGMGELGGFTEEEEVAHRTRSHFRSDPSKKKFRTFSNPYQIDVDETESDSGYSDMSSSEDEEDGAEESVDSMEAKAGQAEATPEEKSDRKSTRRKQVEVSEACSELSNDGANVNRGEKRVVQEESSKMKSNKRKQVKTPKDCSELSHDGSISNINRVSVNKGEKGAAQEESSKRKSNKRHRVQPSRAYSDMSGGEDEDGAGNNMDRVNLYEGEEEAAQKELSKRKSIKRKQVKTPKVGRLFKLLIDIMLSSAKELPEELAASVSKSPAQGEVSHSAESLPLVFAFEDDEPKQAERSEQDMELDQLWADLDFAIESENVGTYRTDMGQVEEINAPEVEANPATPCSKGEHELILNEQIGYTCKLCFKVVQEIRDILPSWTTSFGGSSARKYSFLEDCSSIFDNVSTTRNSYISQGASLLSDGTVWNLIPGVERSLYQHQRDAFEFLWKNLAGSIQLDQLKTGAVSEDVGGCVISHPPGTGKTRLAIMFIQTYMKAFPERRPVIVAPCGILLTWEKELKKWDINLPLHNMNVSEYSGSEDAAICMLAQKEPKKSNLIRLVKLYSWAKGSGILGLSYGLFKSLTVERTSSNSGSDGIRKILLETAGLLVLDEGHTPRNDRTLIWKALEKVQTKQRIILSGTPFQNNFEELYNTLRLVRPKFAERKEITSMTNCISDASLEELKMLIKPFVHVYNGKILDDLPGLRDCVIYLDPLPQQKLILDKIDVRKHDDNGGLETEYKLSLASVHPSLLSVALSEREKSLIDEQLLEKLRLDPNEGIKTKFVMEMVRLAEALNEKVVIFSQYLQPLLMIKDHLIKQFNWIEGHEILQMDGRIRSKHRQSSIDSFNDLSSNAKVLLASIKACCEGICLTGASRVVLLDIVWNPSVERQAISRAYRLGQDKIVYIYRLITSGTSEGVKYGRQVKKDHLSKLVFNPEINLKNVNSESRLTDGGQFSRLLSDDKILEEMASNDKLKDMFVKIYYRIKESNLTNMLS